MDEGIGPQPATVDDSARASAPAVVLSDPRWDCAPHGSFAPGEASACAGEFGTEVAVSVATAVPPELEHVTRVEFLCWPDIALGLERYSCRQAGHVRAGRASVRFLLARPAADTQGNPVVTCDFLFRAKHSRSEAITGAPLRVGGQVREPFVGVLLYSPRYDEYLACDTEAELHPLLAGMQKLNDLRDRSRLAWREPDPSLRFRDLEEVSRQARDFLATGTAGRAKDGVEELLLLQGNPHWGRLAAWNYIEAHERGGGTAPVRGHYRRLSATAAQGRLDELLRRKPARGNPHPLWSGKLALHLLATVPKQGSQWEWRHGGSAAGQENRAFRFAAETAAMRYFAGWDGGEAAFDPRRGKLSLGTAGQASFSLLEGEAEWDLDLPGAAGLNLVRWLRDVKYASLFLADPSRQCLVKLRLQGSVSAFVGATLHGALAVGLDRLPGRGASAGAEAFAGAQVKAMGKASVHWSAGTGLPFHSLGLLGMQQGVSAGLGLEGRLKVTWENGKLCFEMSAAAAWGIGAKAGFMFEADVREGWKLIGHLMDCVDFHFVGEISAQAYAAYTEHAFAELIGESGRGLAPADGLPESRADGRGTGIEGNLEDTCARRSLLRKAPPRALGMAARAIMRARGGIADRALLYLLHSTVRPEAQAPATAFQRAGAGHKLKWTLRHVSDVDIPDRGDPRREEAKVEALRAGIRRVRSYGLDPQGAAGEVLESGASFSARLRLLFRESGLDAVA